MGKYTNMSFNEVKALAEKGDAEAQDSLGSRYIKGEGTAKNESEAVKWFRKSAEQGCPDGECHLGICYEAGLGVKQDYYEAKKWYLKAANKGKDVAQANLASIICNGFVGRPDYDEAALWSKRAADQGFQPAIDNLQVLRNAGLLNERLINNDHFVPEKWNEKTPEKTSKNKDKISFKKRSDLISEGDDYPMTIKVNNEWTFKCPSDCIINYECEFDGGLNMGVDVTGSIKPAVIKGINYQDKFRFNFALEEHFDFFGKGYSIEDCKYDNDILSDSNIYHKVIVDEDDFYVDIIKKTIIFFTDEIKIRVRGSNIKAFNFSSCTSQTDIADRYCEEEVLRKVEEIAKSIKFIKASKKTASKKTSTKDNNPDFIISNGVLKKYIGKSKDVVIPNGVKSIDDNICSGRQDIRSLTIPEGVKAIGRRAFENCYNLEKVTLPDSLKEIGGYAFVDCHKLKTINLPKNLEVIGDSAFSECYVLDNVEIPSKVKEIEGFAFKNCDAFTKVTIPEGVKSIGFLAFAYCDNLEYIYVPASVKNIQDDFMDNSAFIGSDKLTVYGPRGSYVEKYCKSHNVKFNAGSKDKTVSKSTKKEEPSSKQPVAKNIDSKKESAKKDLEFDPRFVARMYAVLINEQRIDANRSTDDIYKIYKNHFPKLLKKDFISLKNSLNDRIKKEGYIDDLRDQFMKEKVKDRYEITTLNYFNNCNHKDFRDQREETLLATKDWFTPEEQKEAAKLLDEEMARLRKNLTEQVAAGGEDWTKFYSAKKYLEVRITDLKDFNPMPAPHGLFRYDSFLWQATVNLTVKGMFGYTAELQSFMPWLWGVSYKDIWEAALNNEIGGDSFKIHEEDIKKTVREAYDDLKEMIDSFHDDSVKFANEIQDLYSYTEYSPETIKGKTEQIIKKYFDSEGQYQQCRHHIIAAAINKVKALSDCVDSSATLKDFKAALPELLQNDIVKARAEKAIKKAKSDLEEAKLTISRSEKSIQDYEEEIERVKKALAQKKQELTEFKEQKGKELEEDKFRITTNQESQKVVIGKLEASIAELEKSIKDTEEELNSTSFFKFSAKKELAAKIDELNESLQEKKDKLPEENSKLYALNTEFNNKVLKHQAEIDGLNKTISDYNNKINDDTSRIARLQQLIEKKKEEIPELEEKVRELEAKE